MGVLTRPLAALDSLPFPKMDTDGEVEVNEILHQGGRPCLLHSRVWLLDVIKAPYEVTSSNIGRLIVYFMERE